MLHALTFSNANYSQGIYGTPTGTDNAPLGLARTREGLFEVIEMGEVVDQASGSPKTLEAITPVNGAPPGCAQVRDAWSSGGYWTTNAATDLLPPAGGLYGAAGIVDVAQGTLYAYDAAAIDGFSDVVQHSGPDNPKPNLATAITDSALDIATAYVPIGNTMVKAEYTASTAGVDAVSAVLMADTVYNEFDIEAGVGAATDWVVTFPTKQFYVDPGLVDAYVQPFEVSFRDVVMRRKSAWRRTIAKAPASSMVFAPLVQSIPTTTFVTKAISSRSTCCRRKKVLPRLWGRSLLRCPCPTRLSSTAITNCLLPAI
jgi:hypothetical protein